MTQLGTEVVLAVEGMTCTGCENNIQFALSSLPGVERAIADHEARTVVVSFDPSVTNEATLRRAIEDVGYELIQ